MLSPMEKGKKRKKNNIPLQIITVQEGLEEADTLDEHRNKQHY